MKVNIIGLGYIGLPTSALIASKSIRVIGVDINKKIVETVNKGNIHIIEPELDILVKNSVRDGLLTAQQFPDEADVHIIVVPTPFKKNNEPDISYVQQSINNLIPLLKKGNLCLIESTSPVGTTQKMYDYIISKRPDLKDDFYMAYCPERVLPGNIIFELVNNDRVVGGINKISTEKAIEFYEKFVTGQIHATNSKTAEMCKLVENASRDVQIAFANELSMICELAEINTTELIELANKHPRVNILKPGCGVGGHCIAVDPYFIISEFPRESVMISNARQVNLNKTKWCITKIINEIKNFKIKNNRTPAVSIFGLAFKPDVDDLRQSPALEIFSQIVKSSICSNLMIVEPNIDSYHEFELTKFENAFINGDILIFLVSHSEFVKNFKSFDSSKKIVLDFCGVTD